jgi:hypothetical protein
MILEMIALEFFEIPGEMHRVFYKIVNNLLN